MKPALSVLLLTTLTGAGQGLLLALVGVDVAARLGAPPAPDRFQVIGAALSVLLSAAGLVASFFHLGRPSRAWRAAAMWRTSWLSREVIVLPAFMAATVAYGAAHALAAPSFGIGLAAAALGLLLYLCTGMIYAAVGAIREWATPWTPVNLAVLGIASGGTLAAALAALLSPAHAGPLAACALGATLLGALTRGAALWRNATLPPRTTLQTALGVRHPRIVQVSNGMLGTSFGQREFFHGRGEPYVALMLWAAVVAGFALPALGLAMARAGAAGGWLVGLAVLQIGGLLAERWHFFATGRHPQNLYHQARG